MPCLFGSDSHTIYWIRYVIYRFHGRSRKKPTLPLDSLRMNLNSNVVFGGRYAVAPHTG